MGKMYFLEVDYSILYDDLGGSRGDCRKDLVGKYDKCIEDKVLLCILTYCTFLLYYYIIAASSRHGPP